MKKETKKKLVIAAISASVLVVGAFSAIGYKVVEGDEAYIRQDLLKGIEKKEVWRVGTHVYVPLLTPGLYKYDLGIQKCSFSNDKIGNDKPDYPAIEVAVGKNGGQKVWVTMSINYKIAHKETNGIAEFDKNLLINMHKNGLQKNYEDQIVKRTAVDVVTNIASPLNAYDIYSGSGRVEFQKRIQKELVNHPVFKANGVLVENVIIPKVNLEATVESKISEKVAATQQAEAEKQKAIAATEAAKRVKQEAQAQVEKTRAEAEANKIKTVLAAEAQAEKQILAAEADRKAKEQQAIGDLALGKAEAEVANLKRNAQYAGVSGQRKAQVEIAKEQASAYSSIVNKLQIVPEKTFLNMGEKLMNPVVKID